MPEAGLTIPALFLEGLLSFFSPCVLPLIPLYMGYLTADLSKEDLNKSQRRVRTMVLTLFFVLGICTVFFLAGLGSSALHSLFSSHTIAFQIAGGTLLVILGLSSLGIIQIPFLEQEHRVNTAQKGKMNIFRAYLMGFFFSFAWSPCIGPLLASAILAASQAASKTEGFVMIGAYSLGFIVIFLLLGLFTEEILSALKKHRNVVKATGILGGTAVLCMGAWMLYKGNSSLARLEGNTMAAAVSDETAAPAEDGSSSAASAESTPASEDALDIEKYDFTLPDAEGNMVSMSDYKGRTILVNFFGTWCQYCNLELPDLQQVNDTRDDVKVLLIAYPGFNGEGDPDYVEQYMKDNGYSMDILYDMDGKVTSMYGISGYPTSYIMKPDGTFLGYMPGYMEKDLMEQALAEAAQ